MQSRTILKYCSIESNPTQGIRRSKKHYNLCLEMRVRYVVCTRLDSAVQDLPLAIIVSPLLKVANLAAISH
jgi:hypothetical protein